MTNVYQKHSTVPGDYGLEIAHCRKVEVTQ